METAFAVLLTNRERLGAAIRMVGEDPFHSPIVATSPWRARTFATRRKAENYRAKLDERIGSKGSFLRDDNPERPELYMTVVDEIVLPPRRPRPDPPPQALLPLVFGPEVKCNRCNRRRPAEVHPCPWCKCPEFRIEEPCPNEAATSTANPAG